LNGENFIPNDFFPYYPYRKGQREIIEKINLNLVKKGHFLLSAPNGTGKSIIALTSNLPLVYRKNMKIIYLCRTHSQNDRIIEELTKINSENNKSISGISIRGRKNMCINDEILKEKPSMKELIKTCQKLRKKDVKKGGCKYYKLFKEDDFDEEFNFNETQLEDFLREFRNKIIEISEIKNKCQEFDICPYYLTRTLLKDMDVIVCNYLWLFHPFIRKIFLKDVGNSVEDCILIIDECHNLPEAVLDINKSTLSLNRLRNCERLLKKYRPSQASEYDAYRPFHSVVKKLATFFSLKEAKFQIYLKRANRKKNPLPELEKFQPTHYMKEILKATRVRNILHFMEVITSAKTFCSIIHNAEQAVEGHILRDWLGGFIEFWETWYSHQDDESYFYGLSKREKKGFVKISFKILPMDSRDFIKPVLDQIHSSLHLSGTVIPEVYENLTGLNHVANNYHQDTMEYPFDKKNVKTLIVKGVSSKNKERNNEMYMKFNKKIDEILSSCPVNIGIFCVGYAFKDSLNSKNLVNYQLRNLIENKHSRPYYEEFRGTSTDKNNHLVEEFKSHSNAVLLGVLGGRNSEGKDFPGKDMETVVIVGFPYGYKSAYIDEKIHYYDKIFNYKGWEYAYLEPSIRKANQAAGRPIRTDTDKGAIIFLDKRFLDQIDYLSKWLKDDKVLNVINDVDGQLKKELKAFWDYKT